MKKVCADDTSAMKNDVFNFRLDNWKEGRLSDSSEFTYDDDNISQDSKSQPRSDNSSASDSDDEKAPKVSPFVRL